MKSRFFLTVGSAALAAGLGLSTLLPFIASPAAAAPSGYQAKSPEYGMSTFLYGNSNTTARDLSKIQALGFGWQKSLLRWRDIEGACKSCFTWDESDRVVQASADAGVKIIARLDWQPDWARLGFSGNSAPDNYQDFADFVGAFMERYKAGSKHGTVQAIEVWNEVNLQREWGSAISPQSAADYVNFLTLAYNSAKKADPNVTIITAGLSPTGWTDDTAQPDDDYLGWMFAAGLKGGVNYDVLAAHGNTQCPSVEANLGACPVMADRMAHPSFYFRRIEQLRDIQVANGDSDHQIWLLEFGWTTDPVNPSYSWYATDESSKAELIVKAFQYAASKWSPWIGVMTVWTLSDPAWLPGTEQVYWAVTNPDGSTRPAYDRLLQASAASELPMLGASGTTIPAKPSASTGSGSSARPTATPAPASAGSGSTGSGSSSSGAAGSSSSRPTPTASGPTNISVPAMAPVSGGSSGQTSSTMRVSGTGGDGVNLRVTPSTSGGVIERLDESTVVQIIGGPKQAEGTSWRNVRAPDSNEGWVAADYLAP